MKKYLFMILAMFTVAFTAVSFTSCSSDDEYVYSGASKLSLYDPDNELSQEQIEAVEAMLKRVGDFNIPNIESESAFMQKLKEWDGKFNAEIATFILANPELARTNKAGIQMVSSGLAGSDTKRYTFKEIKEKVDALLAANKN